MPGVWLEQTDGGGLEMSLFRVSGILETISTISLFFIAMPLKYIGGNEILVKIIGPIHGVLFILYIVLVWWEQRQGRMNMNLAIKGMLAAIPPGGPIWFERRLSNSNPDTPN